LDQNERAEPAVRSRPPNHSFPLGQPYASKVPGSTFTPGPIEDDTATRWT
jgi:hypothetical protein